MVRIHRGSPLSGTLIVFVNESELVAALPRHAPNPQGTQGEDGGAVVRNLEQMEGKAKGDHASIDASQLPLFGLAGEADEHEGKQRRHHTRHKGDGKVR